MPVDAKTAPRRQFEQLVNEIRSMNRVVGQYPTKLHSDEERAQIYKQWTEALLDARALRARDGETERSLWLLAELYRLGHNFDVTDAGQEAHSTVDRCLELFPASLSCHRSAYAFYLAISVTDQSLANAEASLEFVRGAVAPKVDQDVEESYAMLYYYQEQAKPAVAQIDKCLALYPKSVRREKLLQMKKDILADPTAREALAAANVKR